jgi:predicted TIM-barrel enzyme
MKTEFSRAQILDRLRQRRDKGEPIFVANASAGMVAKYAEVNGADIISVHSWARFRYRGHPEPLPTLWWGGSNEMKDNVFDVHHEMENALNDTPLVAGLEAYDSLFRHTDLLLEKVLATGYDGIQNFPTHGYYIPMRMLRDAAGFGFQRELEMIDLAHKLDIFTMAYAFWPDDAQEFVKRGVDVIIAHAGWDTGGSTGAPAPGTVAFDFEKEGFRGQPRDLKGTIALATEIATAARQINPKQLVLITGGSLNSPENAQQVVDQCDVDGFEVGHAIDAIPIEKELLRIGKEYKSLRLNPKNPHYARKEG